MKDERIVISGVGGQLGKDLVFFFESAGYTDIRGVSKEQLDITDYKNMKSYFETNRPKVFINCGAMTILDECEQNVTLAYEVNAEAVKNLAVLCDRYDTVLFQISTDYVFYGDEEQVGGDGFTEMDQVMPLSVYAASKALGETYVQAHCQRYFILRTSWLYGGGNRFINAIIDKVKNQEEVRVVNDQYGTPTSTRVLYACIEALMQTEAYGLYHASCQGSCSRYEFAEKIIEYMGMTYEILPIKSAAYETIAVRPNYSVLDNSKLKEAEIYTFPSWDDELRTYLETK